MVINYSNKQISTGKLIITNSKTSVIETAPRSPKLESEHCVHDETYTQ